MCVKLAWSPSVYQDFLKKKRRYRTSKGSTLLQLVIFTMFQSLFKLLP